MNRRTMITIMATAFFMPSAACGNRHPSIAFDIDSCEYCRMTISDRRHGAAARTGTGRIVRFDSIECLARWSRSEGAAKAMWVVDASNPGTLISLEAAEIRRAASSPMRLRTDSDDSGGLVAVSRSADTSDWPGGVVTWADVLGEVR